MSDFYVISLLRSVQRRHTAQEQLNAAGIDFEFLDGVDGVQGTHELLKRFDSRKFILWHGRPALPGEAGCYASHYLAWQKCVELQRPIVVLEDDFVLSPNCNDGFEQAFSLSSQVDFIRLEQTRPKPAVVAWSNQDFVLKRFIKVPQCATCYLITPVAAAALIRASKTFFLPVDVFIRHVHLHRMPIYGLSPAPVMRVIDSHAISEIGNRHQDKGPFWCKLTKIFFKLRHLLLNSIENFRIQRKKSVWSDVG